MLSIPGRFILCPHHHTEGAPLFAEKLALALSASDQRVGTITVRSAPAISVILNWSMSQDSQESNDERLRAHIHLLNEAANGHLDSLDCPKCGNKTVSVWFTHPATDFYRTWFLCAGCDFHIRAQAAARPPFFTEARVRADLQEKDLAILNAAKFKRP